MYFTVCVGCNKHFCFKPLAHRSVKLTFSRRSLKAVVRSPCQAVTMTLTTNVRMSVFISMNARWVYTLSLFLVSLISGIRVAKRLCRPVDDPPPLSSILGHHPPVHVLQLRHSHVFLDAIAPSHTWSTYTVIKTIIKVIFIAYFLLKYDNKREF